MLAYLIDASYRQRFFASYPPAARDGFFRIATRRRKEAHAEKLAALLFRVWPHRFSSAAALIVTRYSSRNAANHARTSSCAIACA